MHYYLLVLADFEISVGFLSFCSASSKKLCESLGLHCLDPFLASWPRIHIYQSKGLNELFLMITILFVSCADFLLKFRLCVKNWVVQPFVLSCCLILGADCMQIASILLPACYSSLFC